VTKYISRGMFVGMCFGESELGGPMAPASCKRKGEGTTLLGVGRR